VKKHRSSTVPESLFNTLEEEDPAEWTEPKIKEYIATGNKFNSRRINYLLNHGGFAKTTEDPNEDPIETPKDSTETPEDPTETPADLIKTRHTPDTQGFGKELTNLAKIYTEDNKYSGENDNFDFKLIIFYDLCSRTNIPENAMVKAYLIMLRSLALDYYYSNLKNITQTLSLNQICNATWLNFEGPEYKCKILR